MATIVNKASKVNVNDNCFPNEIKTEGTPFISFNAFHPTLNLDALNQNSAKKSYIFRFATYIPQSLNYSLANSYTDKNRLLSQEDFNNLGLGGQDIQKALSDNNAEALTKIGGIMHSVFKNGLMDSTKQVGKLYIRDDFFKNNGYAKMLNDYAQTYGGYILNTKSVKVLQEAGRLSLNTDFEYLIKNREEAGEIGNILNSLKNISMVHTSANGEAISTAITQATKTVAGVQYLGSPPWWDIHIVTGNVAGKYSSLSSIFNKFNCMVLKSITITPISDSNRLDMVVYNDGTPIGGWKLSMSFESAFWQIRQDKPVSKSGN